MPGGTCSPRAAALATRFRGRSGRRTRTSSSSTSSGARSFECAGKCRGGEAFVHELVKLDHDVTFDDESFALVTPGAATGLGLREVVSLVGFQLWALPRPVLDVTYRPEPLESVTLTYDDTTLVLTPAAVRQAFVLGR